MRVHIVPETSPQGSDGYLLQLKDYISSIQKRDK